jgi:hypothetical protein
MAHSVISSGVAALRRAWAALHLQARALAARAPAHQEPFRHLLVVRSPLVRRLAIAVAAVVIAAGASFGFLWWQLSYGSIPFDLVTPWLTSAIEERFGGRHRIEVGGTVIERDETGRTALRLRDIVVRAADGTVVASAPKAEVGIASYSLLTGHVQAQRLSLIGAEMAVRIEPDGQITVYAGGERRQPTTTQARQAPPPNPPVAAQTVADAPGALSAFLAWIDRLDSLGLDGGSLAEVGLKDGSLVVDDRRNGKQLAFEHIHLSLTRPQEGGVAFAVNSTGADGLWSLIATVTPKPDGRRTIEAVVRDVSPKDLMLALRIGDGKFAADVPLSGVLRAEIERDGTPQMIEGRILAGAGYIGAIEDRDNRIPIDEAQLNLRWNAATRQLLLPLEAVSGASRVSLLGQLDVPAERDAPWGLSIVRGGLALAPAPNAREAPLIIDRVTMRARIDTTKRLIEIEQGDFTGMAASFAFSGLIDCSTADPRVAIGMAATRMSVSSLKRLWPVFVVPAVRTWVMERMHGGTIERAEIATNSPISTWKTGGPPLPDDGLSIDIVATGTSVRPIDNLPVLKDADLTARVMGRTATVRINKAVADLPSGRRLTMSNALFDVADTHPKPPPARTFFRVEGAADAAAELLAMDRLRDSAALAFDPATTKGTFVAQVGMAYALTGEFTKEGVNYAVEADLANFAAEKLARGQKVEASTLKLSANSQGYQTRGDIRINGLPVTVDYRKPAGNADAEVRLAMTLDDAARSRLGFDLSGTMTGAVPLKMHGRISANDRDSRFQVEADLKDARIAELLPGWWKAAGRPARATFTLIDKPQSMRFEDLVIEGSGALVKGLVELDSNGDIALASFPNFALSDGDKATLRADRAADGTLKVTMRGELFDGRGIVKSALGGPSAEKSRNSTRDFDLDVKLGTVAGYNGETLRAVEVRMSRRAGHIRSFLLNGKIGPHGALIGDMRTYGGRQVVFLEANDAGAMFRFNDTYPRMVGGHMWVAIDPPTAEHAPQEGRVHVKDFTVRGEPTLERVAAGGIQNTDPNVRTPPQPIGAGVQFSRMQVDFTKAPGKLTLREGVVWGPAVGATIEGTLDYTRDDVRMRGTFVPAYALNNMIARLPVVGLFMGGQNEGLFGITYEVVGQPSAPILRVNPMSAILPGVFRKIFEFRGVDDRVNTGPSAYAPTRSFGDR